MEHLKVDANNFIPLSYVDKSFDMDITGEEIFGRPVASKEEEDKTSKKAKKPVKLGKILTNKYNCGIALIDI